MSVSKATDGPAAAPIQPLFRWAGSKRQILTELAAYWKPEFSRYVEPFAGSAALFFRLRPEKSVLGDINSELIETYEVIRSKPDDLHEAVARIPRSEARYYEIRSQDRRSLRSFERAVRFVYLNRNCFNGIYRTNTAGEFNVPFAHSRPGALPPVEHFRRCAIALSDASFLNADFGKVLSSVRKNDFVYLDPPYAVESRRIFRQYDSRDFQKKDLQRLSRHLASMDKRGASFVLSYADCAEARDLFSCWTVRRIRVRRHIAGFAAARRNAYELLVTNFSIGNP